MQSLFIEFELRKVFKKFNGNRASNNENIDKVHDLPGHPSYVTLLQRNVDVTKSKRHKTMDERVLKASK